MKKTKHILASTILSGAMILQGTLADAQSELQADIKSSESIRPFQVHIPDAALKDLRRINATQWPERETVADESQGVQLATMKALAHYWATDYDWRKCEAKL